MNVRCVENCINLVFKAFFNSRSNVTLQCFQYFFNVLFILIFSHNTLCFCCRFNYRSTHYMVSNGFYNFLNWFDDRAWYPLGRIVGGTVSINCWKSISFKLINKSCFNTYIIPTLVWYQCILVPCKKY